MATDTFYTVLGVPVTATAAEVTAAYERQRERYSPERVAALGDEFQHVATARTTDLERAYAALSDPHRRSAYDRGIGVAPRAVQLPAGRSGISRREWTFAIVGTLAGLLIVAAVWVLAVRGAPPALPSVAELQRPAPDFALPGLDGETVRLRDYRGKVVMTNFWGSWCQPCKEETPELQAVYRKLRDQGLVIVGVDLRNQEQPGTAGDANVRSFIAQYSVTYPIALDVSGDIARAYQIYPIPTSFFIDPSGTIRYMAVSKVTAAEVENPFARLKPVTDADTR
jgi:cytochrome c biogenesis protein CcmG/thiol:disulfide interchange protein DsbE